MTPLEVRMNAAWHLTAAGEGDPLDNFAAALWPSAFFPELDVSEIANVETCRNGHIRTPQNTYTRANGWQYCRDCQREYKRTHKTKQPTKKVPCQFCGAPCTPVSEKAHRDGAPFPRCRKCFYEQRRKRAA